MLFRSRREKHSFNESLLFEWGCSRWCSRRNEQYKLVRKSEVRKKVRTIIDYLINSELVSKSVVSKQVSKNILVRTTVVRNEVCKETGILND